MQKGRKMYIGVRALRFTLAHSLFVLVSLLSSFFAYFMAQRQTYEVSENVIRAIHVCICILAYHSFLRTFILTDKAARKSFYDNENGTLKFLFSSVEVLISFVIFALFIVLFPNAFAIKALYGWFDIKVEYGYIISFLIFLIVFSVTWIESVLEWRKTEEKLRKEKSEGNDIKALIKVCVSYFFAYPLMAYFLPVLFPTLETLPNVVLLILKALLPVAITLFVIFTSFDYVRAFVIRLRFFRKLKKSARKNGYELSKIKRPYASLFSDGSGENFSVTAHGKTYLCKMLCGLHYGNHMYFTEDGKGIIVKSFRLRVFFSGRRGLGRIGWHNGDELARVETHFTYAFEGEGNKVLIICPTPHSIYATGHGQKKLIDVNDKVYGYTVMTATAFVNALERDAVK